MLGAPHEQPTFTSLFEKNCFVQVQIAFQLRFSMVSVFQLRFSYVSAQLRGFFCSLAFFGPKISAFLKVKLLVKLISLCFSYVSAGKNGVLTLWL